MITELTGLQMAAALRYAKGHIVCRCPVIPDEHKLPNGHIYGCSTSAVYKIIDDALELYGKETGNE